MDITLPDHTVAYNLYSRIILVDLNAGRSCRGGNIYIPTAAPPDSVAANAGVVVDYGFANGANTDITRPELPALSEGASYNIPEDIKNTYSLQSRSIQASVDNAIVRLALYYA